MQNQRRLFLRASLAAGTATIAVAAGLLTPQAVLGNWPKKAFENENLEETIKEITGLSGPEPSDKINVKTPVVAENGAVVSVTVEYDIPGAESLSILVPENTNKLAASYLLTDRVESFVNCRIKMRTTSDVIAVIKADGKLYSGKNRVKVTLGGCGG